LAQAPDQRPEIQHLRGIEAGRRLVEYEDARPMHERRGQPHALAEPLRQLPAQAAANAQDVAPAKRLIDGRAPSQPRHAAQLCTETHELIHREVRVEGALLGQVTDHPAYLGGPGPHRQATDPHLAGVGRHGTDHHANGGALAGAVGAEEPADRAGHHLERHAIHRDGAAEPLDDAEHLDHGVDAPHGRMRPR
jgi:hypothetical protein